MSRAYRNLLNIRPQLARGIEWSFWDLSDRVCTCLFKNNNIMSFVHPYLICKISQLAVSAAVWHDLWSNNGSNF